MKRIGKMEVDELPGLIRTGEGYILELKEKLPSDLGRQLCAFANASGGHFYLRVGSTAQQLKRDEIREFFLKERLVRFDEKPNMDFDLKNDFDKKKFGDDLLSDYENIYLDKVDISNPGGLVHGLTKEDFGKRSMPRNPLLMDLFMRIEKVEKAGTGIKRIRDAMKEYGLTAKFDINENWFSVVFPRVMQGATTQKTVEKDVEKTVEKILGLIRKNSRITQKELMVETGLSRRGVEWNLSKLKKEGKLKRIGPDKGGHWEILKED